MHLEQILCKNLLKIKLALGLSHSELSQILEISEYDLNQILNFKRTPTLTQMYSLGEHFKFHAMDLLEESFDLKQLLSNYLKTNKLPEKYSCATYSKIGPIINVLNYIERNRGIIARTNILRHFQITDELLLRQDLTTNILLITDIANYAKEIFQLTEDEFFLMGQLTPEQALGNIIKSKLSGVKTISDNLECFFSECTHLFDTNCTYKIVSMNSELAIVSALANRKVIEELKVNPLSFGNKFVCSSRMGVISTITKYNFNQNMLMTKYPSSPREGMSTQYMLDFSRIKKKLSRFSFFDSSIDSKTIYQ